MTEVAKGVTAKKATAIIKELEPALRPEKRGEALEIITQEFQKLHVGPLPPPEDLALYEQAVPGTGGRIVDAFEREQAHRQRMDRAWLNRQYALQFGGQILGFLALIAMLTVVVLTYQAGHPVAATVLGGTVIVAVVGMFLGYNKAEQASQQPKPPVKRNPKRKR